MMDPKWSSVLIRLLSETVKQRCVLYSLFYPWKMALANRAWVILGEQMKLCVFVVARCYVPDPWDWSMSQDALHRRT